MPANKFHFSDTAYEEYLKKSKECRVYGQTLENCTEEELRVVIGFMSKQIWEQQNKILGYFAFSRELREFSNAS